MNGDLRETFAALAAETGEPAEGWAALAGRLKAGGGGWETEEGFAAGTLARVRAGEARRRMAWRWIGSAAACAAVCAAAGLGIWLRGGGGVAAEIAARQTESGHFTREAYAPHVQAYGVAALAAAGGGASAVLEAAVGALARSQDAEGGWGSAATSARNVAALALAKRAGAAGADVALKRGRRFLRNCGIEEPSGEALAREARMMLALAKR